MLYLIIAAVDLGKVEKLRVPFKLAVVSSDGATLTITHDKAVLSPSEIYSGAIASVVCSAKGQNEITRFNAFFEAEFGTAAPEVIDLNKTALVDQNEIRDVVQTALLAVLSDRQIVQASRNVALSRDVVQLRQQHAQMQEAFARLESYVYDCNLNHRTLAGELLPAEGTKPLRLSDGVELVQRLPRASTGLSDIALSFEPLDTFEDGLLSITLMTAEDEHEHALWMLAEQDLKKGWIRLALPVSMAADPRTPVLKLTWDGPEDLGLRWCMNHPDPRYQAFIGAEATGKTLAMRFWHYVAGCEAPVSSDALLPNKKKIRKRVVPAPVLAAAENLNPACETFMFLEDHGALLMHVVTTGYAVARLAEVVPEGISHVSATIMTRAEQGPDIDYALAIRPVTERTEVIASTAVFRPEHVTPWTRLSALEKGELHLYLSGPLDGKHDLYLMTRPSEGVEDISWGWSTFSAITLRS